MKKHTEEGLVVLIKKLESYIPEKDRTKPSVSTSDVAWQIDHSLKVINRVSESLVSSDPSAYSSRFNWWRFLLFNLNYIPRGRAKSPKIVAPPELIYEAALHSQIIEALINVEHVQKVHENAYFKHFIFGALNKQRTIRFLHLHTNHHLKIIRDIIK